MENVVKLLYLRLLKALYGCMGSTLLWYDIHTKTLKSQGFVVNTYDRCTENIIVYIKQCMIYCYVDDNKVSYVDEHANTRTIEAITKHFGELTLSKEKTQKFLGMDIDF